MSHVAYLVRFGLAATALVAFGCGGSQTDVADPDDVGDDPETEDVAFDAYDPVQLGGTVFQPQGMVEVPDVDISGSERQQAWRQGRQAYEQRDFAAAADAYASLLELYGDDEVPPRVKTWITFVYLRAHKNEEAAALTADYDPAGEDLRGYQAYVSAWSAFRHGDGDRARDFITVAAQKWPSAEGQRAVVNDIVLMTARAGTPAAQADELISEIVAGDIQQRYVLLFRIHEQYVFAGHYDLASAALAHIRDVVLEGQELPPEDVVGFGFRRSDYEFRMNNPDEAAALAVEAYQGLETCGDACAGDTAEAVTQRLSDLARVFHTAYATSLDESFYQPAASLYETYIAVPDRADTETVRGYLSNLQQTHEHSNPAQGQHDAQVMGNVVVARREVIQSCYEEALGWNPDLEGELVLNLQIDQAGEVVEASAEPAPSDDGVGRVASCAVERVADWTFPARTIPGVTSLVHPFTLSTEVEAVPDDATQGPGEAAAPADEGADAG